MSAIRSKDTTPEVNLRKALWAKGLRYRKHYCREKIDVAFPHQKLAIFVDGCFWHSCPLHSHLPKTHKNYWYSKLARNVVRAREKDDRLKVEGWTVLHFWEHEILSIDEVTTKIVSELKKEEQNPKLAESS